MDIQYSNPISLNERIVSLDVLRGVAILGILLMNIVAFSMVSSAYFSPEVYNELAGPNWWTWLTLHYLVDTKFMSIFSILFGAGVCIFMERAQAKSHAAWKLQLSRMGWLLLIGMIHAYLIWYGDILVSYAVCGVAVAFMRKWNPIVLFISGIVVMFLIPIGLWLLVYWSIQYWPEESLVEMQQSADLSSQTAQAEIAAYTGPWSGQLGHRVPLVLVMHFFILPLYICWHVIGLMMVGMAAYKWKILSAAKSKRFYILLIVVSSCIGFPLIAIGVDQMQLHGWDPATIQFLDSNWNIVGGVFIACAWIGLVMLVCKTGVLTRVRQALSAVGRMALTNYIGQSIICTYLFYGHGFGWYNTFERVELLYVVGAVWLFQIIFSVLWLQYFRFGPFEWLWRSATYLELQPMKRNRSLVS